MFYSGTHGDLYIDGKRAAKVRSWSLSSSLSLLDTTDLGSTDTTSTAGVRSTTGACQLFYYDDPTGENSASVLINKLIKAGSGGNAAEAEQVVIRLVVTDSSFVAVKKIEGTVYLTSVSMACAVGEVIAADVAFQFNGAPTEVAL